MSKNLNTPIFCFSLEKWGRVLLLKRLEERQKTVRNSAEHAELKSRMDVLAKSWAICQEETKVCFNFKVTG